MNNNPLWNHIKPSQVLDLAKSLIQIPSYPGIDAQESEVAKFLLNWLKNEGLEVELQDVENGRYNLIAKLKGEKEGKNLLLNGHLDTVPVYGMVNPLIPIEKEDRLYGRGSVDMKGPIASMLCALVAIKKMKVPFSGEIVFAGVIDEEEKSLGAIHFLENNEMLFDGAIVGEPTDLSVCVAHRGLHWIEISIIGKTVHGGHQAEGLNAISLAGQFIPFFEERMTRFVELSIHPIIGRGSFNLGTIQGGTQPSTVAGACYIKFDRRWLPGENLELILNQIQSIIAEFQVLHPEYKLSFKSMAESVMKSGYSHESMHTNLEAEIVKATLKATSLVMQTNKAPDFFPAWSDGGLFNYFGKIPCVILGPGRLDSAHSDEEFISIQSLYDGVEVYVQSILAFYELD
ncbi:MAG: M20 family metallopeptidase [Clostridia bacterium]|nr:M20 family metallopeptidase [Clostridia bacterium]